ncbi:MAG: ribosome maturation factor RimM [Hyphomicrobiaceae bacterium]|nr:ribosome maturation factor RimM [Hyphomicrobiaceae bacterium]
MTTPPDTTRRILLGEIAGAHGIRGDVLVRTFTSEPAAIADYGTLTDAAGNAPLELKIVRETPKGVIARVSGVGDRNRAEALKGRKLYVLREALPDTDGEDDFYHADLIGLVAVDPAGKRIGEVVTVANYGAGDLLEVRISATRKSELIPFTKACVPVVDVAAGRVTIVLPDIVAGEPPGGIAPDAEPSDLMSSVDDEGA